MDISTPSSCNVLRASGGPGMIMIGPLAVSIAKTLAVIAAPGFMVRLP